MDPLMFPLDLGESDVFNADVGCTAQALAIGHAPELQSSTSTLPTDAIGLWDDDWSFDSSLFDETLFDFSSFNESGSLFDYVPEQDNLGLANASESLQAAHVTAVGGITYYTTTYRSPLTAYAGVLLDECSAQAVYESVPTAQEAGTTTKILTQAANRRTKITPEARRRLLQEFRKNAYPSKEVRAAIAVSVGLSETSIRHWFINARQRLSSSQDTQPSNGIPKEPCAVELPHVTTSNLHRLNRESPDPENAALDRFLTNRSAEEPVSAVVISAVKRAPQPSPVSIQIPTPRRSHSVAGSAGSVARSVESVRSIDSRGSRQGRLCWTTNSTVFNPSAEHGWRYGLPSPDSGVDSNTWPQRRDMETPISALPSQFFKNGPLNSPSSFYPEWGFGRDSNMFPAPLTFQTPVIRSEPPVLSSIASDNAPKKDDSTTKAPKEDRPRRLFCTWPDCTLRFRTHFERERHEALKHYRPYDWVCCSLTKPDQPHFDCFVCDEKNITPTHIVRKHFSVRASKNALARTFFRKDQFVQHVKIDLSSKSAAGCPPVIPQALSAYWAFDRADTGKDDPALICGFCGKRYSDSTERSHHVAEHMYRGTCKAAW